MRLDTHKPPEAWQAPCGSFRKSAQEDTATPFTARASSLATSLSYTWSGTICM
jgi:hypothetical protein